MKKDSGKIWAYSITISIILIFFASVATVFISVVKAPVAESDLYMTNYHDADDRANEIIKQEVAFNKLYNIAFVTKEFQKDDLTISYRVEDKQGRSVEGAKFTLLLTRPDNNKDDIELGSYSYDGEIYSFEKLDLPREGRWDLIAKVSVGELERFFSIKATTLKDEIVEF
ncbi:MAG: FixH family protein [Sulfuricurvum sp.]